MNTGAFGEGFPYSNFHDLNMDWIIKIAKDFLDQYTHIQEIISNGEESLTGLTDSGLEALDAKAEELEGLLDQWYNTHSEDIAEQLAQAVLDFNTAAETKSQALLDSWPDDYSELVTEYNELKYTMNQKPFNVDPGFNNNMFDFKSAIIGKDLDAVTGLLHDDANAITSDMIVYDFTKRLYMSGNTFTTNVYCYDKTNTYLGRYNINSTSDTVYDRFPTTAYIRVVAKTTDTDIGLFIYMGARQQDFTPIEGWIDKSDKINVLSKEADSSAVYGNFFNIDEAFIDRDIDTGEGCLKVSSGYIASNKIVMDFTKRIAIVNSTYPYIYCYTSSDAFLGRYNWTQTGDAPADRYPTVAYIRILAMTTDTNIMVLYNDKIRNVYSANGFTIPFSGISKSLQKYMMSDTRDFRIGSYNLGDFTGTGLTPDADATLYTYRNAIAKLNADTCLFQYDIPNFNSVAAGNSIFSQKTFREWHGTQRYDYFGVGSDYPFMNEGRVLYTNAGNYPLTHTWYEVFDMPIHGRVVHFVNIHLEWKDTTYRAQQITELLAHVADYDYCVICGDFNPEDRTYDPETKTSTWNGSPGTLTYAADLARFEAAGFTPANAGPFGVFDTLADPSLNGPWDNILVKGKITVKSFGVLKEAYMDDHYAVYADVTIW